MRIVLLGPPGAGKGSLASLYDIRLGIAHLSTGEIFRQEIARRSALGRRVRRYVLSGRLVPDALVVEVMAARLRRARAAGFVLDGFPRTAGQAQGLDRVLARQWRRLDAAVYLISPQPLLVKRLSGRRVCSRCGANYHLRTMRPKRAGRCDRCGGRLTVRKDDQPRMIRKRLAVDRKAAAPLVAYYRRRGLLHRVNGVGNVETVYRRTLALFRRHRWLPS
ncbi:MAG: nucleoside monophosphate kinase [Candidatus Omnitrophica bacterium]|nr:nucleoside monophosphate kinase [Candidatus Omnitrophota bacterium]